MRYGFLGPGTTFTHQALLQALADAPALGIAPVLVTCDDANHASRRTIEKAGGVLEDVRDGARRYWLGAEPLPSA